MVSILQHCVVDEREELQKDQEKLRIEKEKNILAAKRSAENVSPNPEGKGGIFWTMSLSTARANDC